MFALCKSFLRMGLLLLYFVSNGCTATSRNNDSDAKKYLLEAMKPFAKDGYAEITGKRISFRDGDNNPFILLMGPHGKYIYRCSNKVDFCDGNTVGMVDFDKRPPEVLLIRECHNHEAAVMSIAMAEGPYFFVLARATGDDRWLPEFLGKNNVRYKSKRIKDNKIEITINEEDRWHRFGFSGPEKRPVYYQVGPIASPGQITCEFTFSIIRFPERIPDIAFQPHLTDK